MRTNPKYYHKLPNGKYRISKKIDGKIVNFGLYPTKHEAETQVKKFLENGWNRKLVHNKRIRVIKDMRDIELINKVCSERNVSEKTKDGYFDAVQLFTTFKDMSFVDILKVYEAEEEELPWKKRTIKKDLIDFRNWLNEQYMPTSVNRYFGRVLTVLRHMEVELMSLPNRSLKNENDLPPITHDDLLTREELQKTLIISDDVMRAYICFATSSGCARKEALSLTVGDYLLANGLNDEGNVREELKKVDGNSVPCFRVKRHKTNKYYFTFCTPQANKYILKHLKNRRGVLNKHHPLFKINYYYLNKKCKAINDELDLGKCRKYNRFRSHMLRKYNASTLYNNGMHMEDVDSLQGRGKDSTHSAYFMEDPMKLKEKYLEYVDVLTI